MGPFFSAMSTHGKAGSVKSPSVDGVEELGTHPVSKGLGHVEDIFDIETDPKWQTTRKELWSYYLYYVGNNGLAGFNYGCVVCAQL